MTAPGTVAGTVAALAVLAAAGALPALCLAGRRPAAVLAAPAAGAVLAAGAATATTVIGGGIVPWFAVLALAAAGGAAWCWRRPRWRPAPFDGSWRLQALGVAAVVLPALWWLWALRAPSTGFDTRSIWLLHADWFAAGHHSALAALRNRAIPFAHPSYPPLVGGAVAVAYQVTGNHTARLGVVVVALLNVSTVAVAALAVVEVGRVLSGTLARAAGSALRPSSASWCRVPSLAGTALAGALVLAAAGVAGPFATNGYADLLWAAAATGAVAYALVLPPRRPDLGLALLLLVVAGLTKQEGWVTALVLTALVVARWWGRSAGVPGGRRTLLGAAGAVVAVTSAWPVLCALLGAAPNVAVEGRRQGTDASRARAVASAMDGHLHVLWVALPVAVAGGLVLSALRRRAGLGNDWWAWGALAAGIALVAGTYVTGPGNVAFWLLTSVHRTTMFPALLGWWILAGWAACGSAAVASRPVLGRRLLRPGPLPPVGRPAGAGTTPAP